VTVTLRYENAGTVVSSAGVGLRVVDARVRSAFTRAANLGVTNGVAVEAGGRWYGDWDLRKYYPRTVIIPIPDALLGMRGTLVKYGPTNGAMVEAKLMDNGYFRDLATEYNLQLEAELGQRPRPSEKYTRDGLIAAVSAATGISQSDLTARKYTATGGITNYGTYRINYYADHQGTQGSKKYGSEYLVVPGVDLSADINFDGMIDYRDQGKEDVSGEPGLPVGVNNNTHPLDSGGTEVDHADEIINGPSDKADDLRTLRLTLPTSFTSGDFVLRCTGNSCVRIFNNSSNAVIGPASGPECIIPAGSVSGGKVDYFIEAIAGGQETVVSLAYRPTGGSEVYADTVTISTVGMSALGAYYLGSLDKSFAVNEKDSTGKETDRYNVGVKRLDSPDHPAAVVVSLKNRVMPTVVEKLRTGEYRIYNRTVFGRPAVSLEESIKTDSDFLWFLWMYEQCFDPATMADDLYELVLLAFGIEPEDAAYYWQLPKIHAAGEYLFDMQEYATGKKIDRLLLGLSAPQFVSLSFSGEGPVTWRDFLLSAGPQEDTDPDRGGITWEGKIDVPECVAMGTLRLVQDIKTTRRCEFRDGSSITFATGNQWCLDTKKVYTEGAFPDSEDPGDVYDRWVYWGDDTPVQPIGPFYEPNIEEVTIDEFLKLYLVYVPVGGKPYTLGLGQWQWNARLRKNALGIFLELDPEYSRVPEAPDGIASTEDPVLSPVAFGDDNEIVPTIDDNGHGQSADAYLYPDAFPVPEVH